MSRLSVVLGRSLRPLILLTLLFNIPFLIPPQVVHAASVIQVNSPLDSLSNDGKCTLREAVIAANKDSKSGSKSGECGPGSGADVIRILASVGTVTLTRTDQGTEDASATGDLDVTSDLTIEAAGPGIVIRGASSFTDRIFQILAGNVVLRDLVISGGVAKGDGGGIHNNTVLVVERSTITQNTATGSGGGVFNAPRGSLTLINSTVSGNTGGANGGAVANAGAAVVNNATLTANRAKLGGGGVAILGGTLSVWNSIVAGNAATTAPDCSGALGSAGHDLIGNTAGCSISVAAPGVLTGANILLGPLQNNGGNTPTHALLAGSPAIDSANPAAPVGIGNACTSADQRGALRPRGFACDMGAYESGAPNSATVIRAFSAGASSGSGSTTVVGRLASAPNVTFSVQFYSGVSCDPAAAGTTAVGSPVLLTTDGTGNAVFNASLAATVTEGDYLWAITTDPAGFASAPSRCVRVGSGNDSWPSALRIYPDNLSSGYEVTEKAYLDLPGQSRWYKFTAQPNSRLVVTLNELSQNYDLTLYKDIPQAFETLTTPSDLYRLGVEFASEAFSSEAFSSEAFSSEAFSSEAFSSEAFSSEAFSSEAFSSEAFSPEVFKADAWSPDAFEPDAFSPDVFSANAFDPDAYSPQAYSPSTLSAAAFSSAQSRSLIGISAFDGLVGEGLVVNTWNSTGDFYVRVRGRNGAFDAGSPFRLNVRLVPGQCAGVSSVFPTSTITPTILPNGNYQTLVLTNLSALEGSDAEKATLLDRLATFTSAPEVAGKVIDFSQDARFLAAQGQAQAPGLSACPFAMNLVAGTVKEVVDAYRAANPSLRYLVIVGNDKVIPFFRHPDQAMLGNERNYVPPVRDNTTSQASLRLGYVLSQDDYGARIQVSIKDDSVPVPDLAVGRLVETAAEATGMLDAYLATNGGVTATPESAFVSGYDFLDDVAGAVKTELQTSLGGGVDAVKSLITSRSVSPTDPSSWTASQLRDALSRRYDLIFLAGHFSASSALAADYTTRMQTYDLVSSPANLVNSVVFSVGCHSGYSIVNDHKVPLVTNELDWAQAFAQKQATLIAGTGYQYGDTDFIRYSEKLYYEFARELRVGAGAVAVGDALVRAKQSYLAGAPYLRGIDEKVLLQATLFGLPMLKLNMPGERLARTGGPLVVSSPQPYGQNPGATLGLEYSDLTVQPSLTAIPLDLTHVSAPNVTSPARYYLGSHGVVAGPNEPVLPLAQYNVSVPGKVLRGVGLRSSTYVDTDQNGDGLADGVLPLTDAAVTEIRGVHTPFRSDYFFPVQTWGTNYFSALAGNETRLNVFPVQYRSIDPASILSIERVYSSLGFRLFYSSNIATYGSGSSESTPALAAPPSIARVSSQVNGDLVHFQVRVAGDPAAGVQEVWITYTGLSAPLHGAWRPVDLAQNSQDSTLWEGNLTLNGAAAADVRFIVQAVNGVGLVSMDTNQGSYYVPGVEPSPGRVTGITLVPNTAGGSVPTTGRYTDNVTFSAELRSGSELLAGKAVSFILGPQSRTAVTDNTGRATVTLSIYALPGPNEVRVSFAGDSVYQPVYTTGEFTVDRQFTSIALSPQPASGSAAEESLLTATLTDATGRHLGEETLFFVIEGEGRTYYDARITDYAGRASVGSLPLPTGNYSVKVYFSGLVPLSETVTLSDDRYEPTSFLTGALELLPRAVADLYLVNEDETLNIAAPGVLSNDVAPLGASLSATLVAGPASGALSLLADGSFTYAPGPNFHGSDSFTYQATDGRGVRQATATIQVASVNDVPVAAQDSYSMLDTGVLSVPAPGLLANDTDADGDALSAVLVNGPSSGQLTLNADGSFVYSPAANFNGSVSFAYQASDGIAVSAPATVSIQVVHVNQPPTCGTVLASPDSLWTPNGQMVRVALTNVADPEGNSFVLVITSVWQDEPVGTQPDAVIWGSSADLRAERDGNGDGRVYHVRFQAVDALGASCSAEVRIGVVPHDQSGNVGPIDGGALYDSTIVSR